MPSVYAFLHKSRQRYLQHSLYTEGESKNEWEERKNQYCLQIRYFLKVAEKVDLGLWEKKREERKKRWLMLSIFI